MDFNVSEAKLLEGVRWNIDGLFSPWNVNSIVQLKNCRVAFFQLYCFLPHQAKLPDRNLLTCGLTQPVDQSACVAYSLCI